MADLNSIQKLKDSPAVIAHVGMMQDVINRLADVSARCKEWCFAFIGALLVLIFSVDLAPHSCYIIIPYFIIALFYILDSYYLGLERSMRDYYKDFINSINEVDDIAGGAETVQNTNAQIIKSIYFPHLSFDNPSQWERFKRQLKSTLGAMVSLSTILPYGILLIMVIVYQILFSNPSCNCCCQ